MRLIIKYILRGGGKILAFLMPCHKEFFNYQIPSKIYQIFFIKNTIFLNVGIDCRAALHLKAHLLRKCSAPLDWMMRYSLESAYSLYKSEFIDFFSVCSEDKSKASGDKRFVVANNGMVSMHHFPLNVAIDAYLPTFKHTMQRRFINLKAKIIQSKYVVFVCHRSESMESLCDFVLKMRDLIKSWDNNNGKSSEIKRIFLINILHNENVCGFERQIYKISDDLEIIQFVFNDTSKNQNIWLGNKRLWGRVMSEIEMLK